MRFNAISRLVFSLIGVWIKVLTPITKTIRGNYFLIFTSTILLLFSCKKEDKLTFFEVNLMELSAPIDIGELKLQGSITKVNDNFSSITHQGFIWSTDLEKIQTATENVQKIEVDRDDIGNFSAIVNGFAKDSIYYFRAFAEGVEDDVGVRLVLSSNIEVFSFGINLQMLDEFQRFNRCVIVKGDIFGLENNNLSALNHGFVYSSATQFPEINEHFTTSLGVLNDDITFMDTLNDLKANIRYYVRCWVENANNEICYSNTTSFYISDVWLQVASLPSTLEDAVSISFNDLGIVGLGSSGVGEGSPYLFEFNPNANANLGEWNLSPTISSFTFSTLNGCISFQYDNTLFVGLGKQANGNLLTAEMRRHDLAGGDWSDSNPSFPVILRSGISFVKGNKLYIGTGDSSPNQAALVNTFWELDLNTPTTFREVAPLPLRLTENGTIHYDRGRFEAISFVYQGDLFVGGGYAQGEGEVKDLWKFIPPPDDISLGSWEFVGFLPGSERLSAVALVQQNRIFYGMGEHPPDGELNDWWEYLPNQNIWVERTPLPACGRVKAVTLSIGEAGDERGFLGTGSVKKDGVREYLSDFWEYIPAEEE